ncbi:CPBP family intramembrane glutamic endopeptidase [Nocardiopsis halophila]|uniref:CPBP family intramembrane glutamic endopeptidase n=1 Tax=Nocardiopsis halophila TaxID=141692 RepID=UPI000348C416|nr:type II CAAX endopeptidase family protein [Nocardiopsis halophila]
MASEPARSEKSPSAAPPDGGGPERRPAPVRAVLVFFGGALVALVAPPLAAGVLTGQGPGVLVAVALVELLLVGAVVGWWLRSRRLGWSHLGLSTQHWVRDAALGAAVVLPRLALEFGLLVPMAGGADNTGVREVLDNAAAGGAALAATLLLGVVGGGIAEEVYFRGFLIGALPEAFRRRRRAVAVAAVVSVLLFGLLHLPANGPDAVSITVAGLVYAGLFLATGRLTASVVSHGLWNTAAVVAVLALYG